MSKINDCQVAQIAIFCPEADENVYLQWFNDDPSDGANGPIFQFFLSGQGGLKGLNWFIPRKKQQHNILPL